MSIRREHVREGCLFGAMSFPEVIVLKNKRISEWNSGLSVGDVNDLMTKLTLDTFQVFLPIQY